MTTPNSFAWHSFLHRDTFDFRAHQPLRVLRRDYASLTDILMLNSSIRCLRRSMDHALNFRALHILEVGCATGELYRYLSSIHRNIEYTGMDISRSCIERAVQKYPAVPWFDSWDELINSDCSPDIIYCKDVLHHQTEPLDFLSQLFALSPHSVILRCRTRDDGETEWNPERSCQYVYGLWVPYIIINRDTLISQIQSLRPDDRIEVSRNYTILGGSNNRLLPKPCYDSASGTAETSIRIGPYEPTDAYFIDCPDNQPRYDLLDYTALALRRLLIWK